MDYSTQLPKFSLNCPKELVQENVRINIRRHLPQVQTYQPQEQVIGLVGGGPSLDIDEIRAADNLKFVSMNGTHEWLLDNGITPSAHIQVDARESNERFIQRPQRGKTKYLIASQCPPSVFEKLDGCEVFVWHGISTKAEIEILDEYYLGKNYFHVLGGSTVMLRAFTLMSMLGFRKFEVFGFDSCYLGDDHHAYDQPENDEPDRVHLRVGDREFLCAPWMFSQAKDFIAQTKAIGKYWDLKIHGNGLINHIVNNGEYTLTEI